MFDNKEAVVRFHRLAFWGGGRYSTCQRRSHLYYTKNSTTLPFSVAVTHLTCLPLPLPTGYSTDGVLFFRRTTGLRLLPNKSSQPTTSTGIIVYSSIQRGENVTDFIIFSSTLLHPFRFEGKPEPRKSDQLASPIQDSQATENTSLLTHTPSTDHSYYYVVVQMPLTSWSVTPAKSIMARTTSISACCPAAAHRKEAE